MSVSLFSVSVSPLLPWKEILWHYLSRFHIYALVYDILGKAMAPHSSTLAWKIPWMEEPGRLQSMGSLKVGHDWMTSLSLSRIGEGNGNPLQYSCQENPRDGGALWAAVYGVTQSRTRLMWLSSSIWYLSFSFWLTSLCIIGSRFIHLIRNDWNVILFMAEYYSIVYMHQSFFIHSSVSGHLGCFHAHTIVNNAAMDIGVHVYFSILVSLGYMPRSGIAGSCGGFIASF